MNLQRIFDRYNGDHDLIANGPWVTWAEMDIATAMVELEKRISALENRFTAPEPQPACKQNRDWMLEHLKDIASEIEIESDLKLWDSVQDLEEIE